MNPQTSAYRDPGADEDRRLILAVAQGSGDALSQLYDRHAPTSYALARRVLSQPDLAEEVVQDVFAQIWREAARYEPARATVAGWIVMLTRARAIDRLRALRARPDQAADAPTERRGLSASRGRTPEDISISVEDARQVRSALVGLPDNQRMLIELAFYEGLTHSEIAQRTGLPLGTVKTRLRTAMSTLRAALVPTPGLGGTAHR